MDLRIVGIALLMVVAAVTEAVTINQPSLVEPPLIDSLRITNPTAIRDNQLREIAELMTSGKQQDANIKIAQILAKRPKDKDALELAGISLMMMKNFVAAEEAFSRLVALPPVKAEVVSKYGVTKILTGDVEGGVKLLQQVVQFQPQDRLANRYLGWVAEKAGDFQWASYYLGNLPPPKVSGIQDYHIALARNYEQLGDYLAIVDLFAPVITAEKLANSSLDTHAALYLSVAYAAQGELKKSEALAAALQQILKDNPLNLFRLKISLANITKNIDAAKQAVDELLLRFPQAEAMARFELAKIFLVNDDLIGALEQYETSLSLTDEQGAGDVLQAMIPLMINANMQNQAVEVMWNTSRKYPNNENFIYSLAELQAATGRVQASLRTLKDLVERPEPHLQGLLLAGNVARSDKRYSLAQRYLDQLVVLQPNNEGGWVALAGVFFDQGNTTEATKVLERGISANPNKAVLRYELGTLFQAVGDLDSANNQYEAALAMNGDYLAAIDNLASNLLDRNQDVARARELAAKAYAKLPDDPYIQDLWGWALYRAGELQQAEKLLREASAGIQVSGRADYHLALALRDLGETEQANKHFRLALKKGLPDEARSAAHSALQEEH